MHSFLTVYPFALDFDVLFIRGIKIKQKKTPRELWPVSERRLSENSDVNPEMRVFRVNQLKNSRFDSELVEPPY